MSNKTQEAYCDLFKEYFEANRAFGFWKGRVALYAVLKSLGISQGDEVILPGYTCVMNVNPIKYLGAKPVYIDIEPDTFNIDTNLIEEKITDKTKLIITQHTYGYTCNMDKIMAIAQCNNLPVIEDCCLTLGSKYKGKLAGTFGKASYFSFQWNKPYTTGLGGMTVVNNEELADKIKLFVDTEVTQPSLKEIAMLTAQLMIYRLFIFPETTAIAQSIFRYLTKKGVVVGSSSNSEFKPIMAEGFLKAMSPIQISSGLKQFRKLSEIIQHRKKMAKLYDSLLEDKGWHPRKYDSSIMDPVMVRYPLRIKEKSDALAKAPKAGIELGSWFECPLHPIETPLEEYDYKPGMCPQAEKAASEVVNLPLHPRASEKVIRKSVEFITHFTQAD